MTSVGGSSVGYDARQNITSSPFGSFGYNAYNANNELTSATVSGATTAFSYDPAGRLYQSGTTRFLYDGHQAIGEYNTSGALIRRHIPGAGLDDVVLTYNDATTTHRRWPVADERGSVLALTGASAAALSINQYDEYGQPASINTGRFGYTGQMWLPEAQLYHYRARAYAPQLGRFLQTDPIGYGDGASLYTHVRVGRVEIDRSKPGHRFVQAARILGRFQLVIGERGARVVFPGLEIPSNCVYGPPFQPQATRS